MSFQTVYGYYAKMAHYRNAAEIPLILVGTQGELTLLILLYYDRSLYGCLYQTQNNRFMSKIEAKTLKTDNLI